MSLAQRAKLCRKMKVKRTYKDWKSRGRQVQRGEKAVAFDKDGYALFEYRQTKASKPWGPVGDEDYDEDMLIDDYVWEIGDR